MTHLSPQCESPGNGTLTAEQKIEMAFIMDGLKASLARCLKVEKAHLVLLVHEPQACVVHSNPHIFANMPAYSVPYVLGGAMNSIATRGDQVEKISSTPQGKVQ